MGFHFIFKKVSENFNFFDDMVDQNQDKNPIGNIRSSHATKGTSPVTNYHKLSLPINVSQ